MKIYTVYGFGSYANGLAVVAAISKAQAVKVLTDAKVSGWNNNWGLDFDKKSAHVIRGSSITGKPRVLAHQEYIE